MLLGLGNDIVSVKRIKNSYQRFGKRLENRIYTTAEIKLIWERGSPCFKTLSSRWAAKEAFVKALGTGFRKGIFYSLHRNNIIPQTEQHKLPIFFESYQFLISLY